MALGSGLRRRLRGLANTFEPHAWGVLILAAATAVVVGLVVAPR